MRLRTALKVGRRSQTESPLPDIVAAMAEPQKGAGPLKGATPRRGVWRRSPPLLLAGTSATTASDLAVFLNGVLSLFMGEALG